MYKFREPTFLEYLLYDVERFHEKGRRERFVIAMQFLEGSPNVEILSLSEGDRFIREFTDFLSGKGKVVPIGG
jgi:hypothetical protein